MNTKHTDSVEATIQDFSSKFYYPIQQKQAKYEDLVDWLRTTLTTQNQAARTAGYQAAVADLSGKPLTAIELMYDEAYARGYKEADERLREVVREIMARAVWQSYDETEKDMVDMIQASDVKTIAAKHGITNL